MPMKFDLIFFPGFHSTVSIFHDDGTVAISSGGIEIGQGINTKVRICHLSNSKIWYWNINFLPLQFIINNLINETLNIASIFLHYIVRSHASLVFLDPKSPNVIFCFKFPESRMYLNLKTIYVYA